MMRKPNMEWDLNKSSSGSVLFGFGLDWSCGPQLASVNGMVVWEGQPGQNGVGLAVEVLVDNPANCITWSANAS
eukprot:5833446-Ditylum_brightwellii.AAC.1